MKLSALAVKLFVTLVLQLLHALLFTLASMLFITIVVTLVFNVFATITIKMLVTFAVAALAVHSSFLQQLRLITLAVTLYV